MRNKLLIPVLAALFVICSILLLLFSIKAAMAFFVVCILVAVVFFHTFWGLLLFLAMLYLRPQEFVEALKAQPLMLALSFLVLGTLIVHNTVRRRGFVALDIRQGVFMIVFFILIPVSQLQRFYLTGAKEAFEEFLPVFIMFFMIINLVTNFNQLKKTFNLLFLMTLFLAANGILQYFRGVDIAGQTMDEGRIRWIGIFEDPNDLGLTILAFTPYAILSIFKKKKRLINRILWTLVLGILIYALYLTNSRGTFIGLLAVIVYMLSKRWGVWKGVACGVVLAAVLYVLGPSRLADINPEEASASGRIDAWATGLNLLKWRPLLGIGFGSFTEYHHLTAHNSVVLCMAELGLAGLFVWLLLIITSLGEVITVERRAAGTDFALYAEALQLSVVGYFTSAFFLSRTYNDILYIIIALCVILSRFAQEKFKYRITFLRRKTVLIVIGAEIGLIALIKILASL